MIKLVTGGNIFASTAQTLVNPVNCVGTMGAGLAYQFHNYYPDMFDDYQIRCSHRLVQPGIPYLFRGNYGGNPWILNFPTKGHWRDPSKLEWIERGLSWIVREWKNEGIGSLALPALGAGLGQLNWDDVLSCIRSHLKDLPILIEVYEPHGK